MLSYESISVRKYRSGYFLIGKSIFQFGKWNKLIFFMKKNSVSFDKLTAALFYAVKNLTRRQPRQKKLLQIGKPVPQETICSQLLVTFCIQHYLNANSYLDEFDLWEINLLIRFRFHDIVMVKANICLSEYLRRPCFCGNNAMWVAMSGWPFWFLLLCFNGTCYCLKSCAISWQNFSK